MANTNEERIDNCVTELIEVIVEDIKYNIKNNAFSSNSEIEALASLLKARATIKFPKSYLSDSGSSKE